LVFGRKLYVLLQNAVELQVAVARLEANQRVNISSFPDEVDLEVRLLNRLLINFLASARAFVDSVKHRLSEAGEPLAAKLADFKTLFNEQFDAEFSFRLMEALRNYSQHRAAVIGQTSASTNTSITWTALSSLTQSSRHSGRSVS
jgi:hypothetical protein